MLDYTILNKKDAQFTRTVENFDISLAINEITEIMHDKLAMKSIQLTSSYEGFPTANKIICSDMKRIQQVFLNLLSNAVKFTDRNGKIQVLVELQPQVGQVRISVTDNGVGIKKKD
jgi:signal transduction histidine kinase